MQKRFSEIFSALPSYFSALLLKAYLHQSPLKYECILKKITAKIVSEYDREIPQSQTADNPVAPRGRAAQPSQDTRKTI